MSNELNELKNLLQKEGVIKEEIQKLLHWTVSTQTLILPKIPKTEKGLSKIMIKKVSILNERQCPWLDLRLHDSFLNDVYIFGREKDILCNLKEIAKRIVIGRECKIGNIGISFSLSGKFNLKDFINIS